MASRKQDMCFADLYAKYGPLIYSRCRRLMKDSAAAEDATQDVFLKLIKHLGDAPTPQAIVPWIHRITTNHCLNALRDGRRRPTPVREMPEIVDDEFEETLVSRNFARRVLQDAPESLKAPAILYHRKGMEQAKVAEVLGCSRRTVLYRLSEFTRRAVDLHRAAETGTR